MKKKGSHMRETSGRRYSILIVSASEQLTDFVKKTISGKRFDRIEVRRSVAQAAQELANQHYDVVVVNTPLPDDFGVEFVLMICEKYTSGVLVLSPGEVADDITERVIDYGVILLAKPLSNRALLRNLRHLCAIQDKIASTEKKILTLEEKITEMRAVSQAKCLLIEKEHMTEADAHRLIGKQAMDRCISRKAVAEEIIDKWE
jgi:response regulator NasT